ncbi:MAG: SprB repeat-containing protein, partial [Salibacteraceae bacterium]|nr:SprB repeat-containing protein [Salibacteraceae bacterium]
MKRILLLFTAFLLSYSSIWAQCTIISNASQTTSLTGGVTTATEFSVGWNPVSQRYYSTISGIGAALMTYSNAGSLVSTVYPTGVYNCGIWWNNNLGQLETNGYSSTGLFTISTNTSGNALGTATNIYTGYNQPATYAQGDYDYDANEVIYKTGSTIYRYNRTNGTQIGTVTLSGTTLTSLNAYFVGYTGCSGKEYVVYDYQTYRALFFSKSTGNYVGFSQLPTTAPSQTTYSVSYANNKIFIHNGSSWLGYDVIETGISTSSISGPFCGGSSVSVNFTTDTITFLTGNIFTAQLSNASGSFSSPTNIGTVTSTTASTISATIPTSTPFGSNYRIRVVSSSPAYTGSDNGTNIIINLPTLELGASQTICTGSTVQLSGPTGATSYSWSNGSNTQNINVSNPGTYSLTISNSVCSDADTVVVTGISPVTPTLADTVSTCIGGSTTINATTTGIASYVWNTGATTASISPTTAGYYTVTTTDNNSCTSVDSTFLSIVNANITPGDTNICLGDSVDLYAIGSSCYFEMTSLSNTGVGAVIINSGYDDRGGIAVDDNFIYAQKDGATVKINKSTLGVVGYLTQMDGLFSDLATSSLYTFWSTTSSNFNYASINSVREVDQNLTLGSTVTLSQTLSLPYGSLILAGNGFVGVYNPTLDDLYKIDLSTGVVTTINNNLILLYTATENWASWGVAECNANNEYTFVYRYGSYFYEYQTSNNTVSLNTSLSPGYSLSGDWGTFVYSASDNRWYNSFEGSGIVGQSSAEGVGYANATVSGATGAGATSTHLWSNGATSIGISVSPSSATSYSVIVSDGISTCYDTVAIGVSALPTISIADTVSSCNVDSAIISGPSGSNAYLWSNGSTTQNTYFTRSGFEWLKVTNSNGCSATDTVLVSIVDARLNVSDTTVCSADSFRIYPENSVCGLTIQTMTTNNVSSRFSGVDDRGGIAATEDYIYYNSTSGLMRFDANNIASGSLSNLGANRDGIFSDLSSGQLYTLWYNSSTDFFYNTQYVDAIRKMDANGILGATLNLSQQIPWNPTCCYYNGIFAGEGYLILWIDWNNTLYKIDLGNGQVSTLGTANLTIYNTDIYHFWGVAECNGDDHSIVARLGTYLSRYDIATSTTTALQTQTLGSTGVIAYSPWREKWYGYSEAAFNLGSTYIGSEYLYEADATDINYGNSYANLSFTWSNGDTTSYLNVSPDTTTSYSLTVTDGITSCYDTVTFTVIQSPIVTTNQTDVLCNNDSTGNIGLNVSGGVSPYAYLWSNGSENDSISGLTAGTYSVTVTGSNACVVPIEFTLTEPTAISSSLTQTQSATCFEATDGGAYVVASGGVGPYTYLWESGETNDTASALNGDFNSITITDANACERIDSIDITSPQAISAAGPLTTSNGFICPGNSTTITAVNGANGTGTSTFTGTTNTINFSASNQTLSLNALSVPTQILGNASLTVYFQGDRSLSSEYLQVYGENSYYIGATTGMPNTYCNGYVSQTFTVSQSLMQSWISNGSLQLALYNYGMDYCSALAHYGEAYIEVSFPTSNQRTYWFENSCETDTNLAIGSGPSISVSPASTRKFFTINYLDGCYSTCDSITITVAPSFGLNFTVANNPICAGNSTAIIVSGAANNNYNWSPSASLNTATGNSVTASPAATQPYSVQYTDFFGCTQYDTVTVNVFAKPLLNILSVSNATCNTTNDGYAAVFGSNGQSPYTYSWPSGTTNALAFNLYAGTYVVSVTDGNGCTDTAAVNIGVNVDVTITSTSTNPSCNGSSDGSISVTATGGSGPFSMSWSTGATTNNVSGLAAGTYTVTVTDNNGCYDSLVVTLNEPALLTASIDSVTAQSCAEANNGALFASGQGGNGTYSYAWSNGAATAANSGIAAGIYTVTITDGSGCTATDNTTLTLVSSNLAAAISQVQGLTCFGASEALLAGSGNGGTGALSYNWSNSSTNDSIYNVAAGNYILTVNDAVGCLDTASFEVINPAAMTVSLTQTDVACNGGTTGSISTIVSGGTTPYSYAWNTSSTASNLTGLSAASYT